MEKFSDIIFNSKDLEKENCQDLEFFGDTIFKLKEFPDLIVKTYFPHCGIIVDGKSLSYIDRAKYRNKNTKLAKKICEEYGLDLLIVPRSELFYIKNYIFVVEDYIPATKNFSMLEEYFKLDYLDETIRQLSLLIAKTGWSDVEWRNMAVLDTDPEFGKNRRVLLYDFEEMGDFCKGMYGGGFGRRGLICCLFKPEQIEIAEKEFRKSCEKCATIKNYYFEDAKTKRFKELENEEKMMKFYREKGIVENPKKPIELDNFSKLELDLSEIGVFINYTEKRCERITISIVSAITDIISAINKEIRKTPADASLKIKRYILLSINKDSEIKEYERLGVPENTFFLTGEMEEKLWIRKILKAMVKIGMIYEIINSNGHGYFLQV